MANLEQKEERAILLEAWRDLEIEIGDQQEIAKINEKQPKKVKKRRKIKLTGEDDDEGGISDFNIKVMRSFMTISSLRRTHIKRTWK